MAKKVGVGIIGCGVISGRHALGYLTVPNKAEIIAVSDVNEEAAKRRASEWGVKNWSKDYMDLLRLREVDAVDICLPHDLHAPVTVAAAEAGKHVIVDKPIARTVNEADQMISATRKAGVKLMVSYNQRFLVQHEKAKNLIDEGIVGEIGLATASLYGEFATTGWRASVEKMGGGILIDSGSHRIDILRWMVGDVTEVFCATQSVLGGRGSRQEGEDTAFVMMRFRNGAIGQLSVSWGARGVPWTDAGWNETLLISGTSGTVMTDNLTSSLKAYVKGTPLSVGGFVQVPFWQTYWESVERSVQHFVDCIQDDRRPLISGEDGRAVVQIVEAAYRSAKEKRPVSLR